MQHKAVYLLFCKFTLHVSGANHIPSSGVHQTVTTASGTGHIFCAATALQRSQAWPRCRVLVIFVVQLPPSVAKLGHVGGR